MHTTRLCTIAITFVFAFIAPASAQAPDPSLSHSYGENNPAPDYLVFRHYLRLLSGLPDETPEGGDVHDFTKAHFLRHSLDFEHDEAGDAESQELADYLMSVHASLSSDIDREEKKRVCSNGFLNRNANAIYSAMDKLTKERDKISEAYYLEVISTIGSENAVRLDAALQDRKRKFSSYRSPAAKMYEGTGVDVRQRLTAVCENLARKGV